MKRNQSVNYTKGFWLQQFKKWYSKRHHTLTIKIRWLWVLFVLALWPHPHKTVYGDPIGQIPSKISQVKTLPDTSLKPQEAAVAVSEPVVSYVAPSYPVGTSGYCGDNMYKQYIYSHESGCDTGRWNSSGCVGIGQACPASKLLAVCPNLDFACEDAFFTAYANAAYGGWTGAYQAWLSKSWW